MNNFIKISYSAFIGFFAVLFALTILAALITDKERQMYQDKIQTLTEELHACENNPTTP